MVAERFADEGRWSSAALAEFDAAIDRALASGRSSCSLCLAGGSTPAPFYRELAARPLDRMAVELWLGDERAVAFGDPARNGAMLSRAFDRCVWSLPPRLHQWPFDPADPERSSVDVAAARYAKELEAALGPDPAFDLLILGLGTDGHTASLFPGSPLLGADPSAFGLAAPARASSPPLERMTLSLRVLKAAKRTLFLVRGHEKAAIVARLEAGDPELPASRLDGPETRLLFLL
jgi:6-phosphogluconolactonase